MTVAIHTCEHDHAPLKNGAVMQFHAINFELPGRLLRVEPYQPADIEVEQHGCHFIVTGHYGFELFSGHEFVVTIAGERKTFNRWEDIPNEIDAIVKFTPGNDPHDIDFTYHYEVDGQACTYVQNVHNESCGWVMRLQELLRREAASRRSATCQP